MHVFVFFGFETQWSCLAIAVAFKLIRSSSLLIFKQIHQMASHSGSLSDIVSHISDVYSDMLYGIFDIFWHSIWHLYFIFIFLQADILFDCLSDTFFKFYLTYCDCSSDMYLDNFIWRSSPVQHYYLTFVLAFYLTCIVGFLSDILSDTMCICIIEKIYTSDSESLAYILYRQMTKPSFYPQIEEFSCERANLETRLFSSFRKLNAGICSVHLVWNYIKCSVYMRNWGSHDLTLMFYMLRLAGDRYFKVSHFSKEV
jgi:hypothetical protein